MELEKLNGTIIGVVKNVSEDISHKLVKDMLNNKASASLKMVGLNDSYLNLYIDELSYRDYQKVLLASKLHDKVIILNNFSKGLLKKDIEFFKILFRKITEYDRKIIIIDKNAEMFFGLVDNIYVFNENEIIYETNDIYDKKLEEFIDLPMVVKFVDISFSKNVKVNHYKEFDELLKAIYRIKS